MIKTGAFEKKNLDFYRQNRRFTSADFVRKFQSSDNQGLTKRQNLALFTTKRFLVENNPATRRRIVKSTVNKTLTNNL